MKPVSKKEIEKMKELYRQTIGKSSTENLKKKFPGKHGMVEAECAWISKKELLKLLEDNDANGLRIHYGCHHDNTHEDPKEDMHSLHNVILVATKDSVNSDNPTVRNSIDQLSDEPEQNKRNLRSAANEHSYRGQGADALPLCPPNCSGTR